MKLGISSSSLYPELLETSVKRLCDSGIKYIEIFINTFSECEKSYLQELRKMADDAGVSIISLHPFTSGFEPFMFFTNYPRRFNDAIEMYKRFCECANILGSEILVFHGAKREFIISYEDYFAKYSRLIDACQSMGVTVAHENIPRCISHNPEFFKKMHEYIPDAKCVLDTKQAVRAGFTVDEMRAAMGTSLAHIHISDHNENNDCLKIGSGSFDIYGFLNKLLVDGYSGGIMIELYRDNFKDFDDLCESYNILLKNYLKLPNCSTKFDYYIK